MSHDEDFLLQQMSNVIDEYGWAVTGVFDSEPPFAYTAGLTGAGKPELFMTGLDIRMMALVLNSAANDTLQIGDRTSAYTSNQDYKLAVVACDPIAAHMAASLHLYGLGEVRALQLVWPDQKHRYPWDRKYNHKKYPQPVYPVDEGNQ